MQCNAKVKRNEVAACEAKAEHGDVACGKA
jgi:hypothetical protein